MFGRKPKLVGETDPLIVKGCDACGRNMDILEIAATSANKLSGDYPELALEFSEILNGVAEKYNCSARLVLNAEGIYEPVCSRQPDDCPHKLSKKLIGEIVTSAFEASAARSTSC